MDYTKYNFTKTEFAIHFIIILGGFAIVAKLFFGAYSYLIFLLPLYFPVLKYRKEQLNEKRKQEVKQQFKDALISMADSMNVGYSVENAIQESYKEMVVLYGRSSYICNELLEIIRKIELNSTVEQAFNDFAKRVSIDEITLFSQIFNVAKRTGGNMASLIQMVANNISESFRIGEEISVSISEKRLEQRVMSVVPIGIIGYINVTSPGFLDVMYETVAGKIIMSVVLVVYIIAVLMSERIMQIDI